MLYQGIAAASVVGLLMGGALKPSLREIAGPDGPQMLSGVSGKRVYRDGYGEADFTSWTGQPPDYVVGTDWLRPPVYPDASAYEPPSYNYDDYAYEELPPVDYAAPAPYELADLEPPPPPPRMPSLDGDVLAGVGIPPPPEPPVEDAYPPEA
ncbi:hypothetical protein [Phenylobacterium sp.]|uniref:hypothetical protein n=1 Tax=Phenylobacterium sp. TaxID=1871053 RepID=UPI002E2FB1BD|nr:hypothetical protein [Phenylobacterium sp.]HEX2560124.1 hypothetical protein [Phenylobacterium sp.]